MLVSTTVVSTRILRPATTPLSRAMVTILACICSSTCGPTAIPHRPMVLASGTLPPPTHVADRLDPLLQLLIVVQPAANLINTFAPDAELLRTSPGITHRQHEHPMAFTARAFGAAC